MYVNLPEWVHLGSLWFTWVDLVGSGRHGIKWVILEAQESHTHTEFIRSTEILSDLIIESRVRS